MGPIARRSAARVSSLAARGRGGSRFGTTFPQGGRVVDSKAKHRTGFTICVGGVPATEVGLVAGCPSVWRCAQVDSADAIAHAQTHICHRMMASWKWKGRFYLLTPPGQLGPELRPRRQHHSSTGGFWGGEWSWSW